jgi:hypothetical protein
MSPQPRRALQPRFPGLFTLFARRTGGGNIEKVQLFPKKYNQAMHAPFEEQLRNECSECVQDRPIAWIAIFSDGRSARNTCAYFQMLVF